MAENERKPFACIASRSITVELKEPYNLPLYLSLVEAVELRNNLDEAIAQLREAVDG